MYSGNQFGSQYFGGDGKYDKDENKEEDQPVRFNTEKKLEREALVNREQPPIEEEQPNLPHGVVATQGGDGSTTYSFQGNEYSSLEDVPAKTWPWLETAASFAGQTLMSSPTLRTLAKGAEPIVNVLTNEAVVETLTLPGEDWFADQVGLSAQKWNVPYSVGQTLGYIAYPGLGEFRHPPKFFKRGLQPAFVGASDGSIFSRPIGYDNDLKLKNYYEAHSGLGTGAAGRSTKAEITGPGGPKGYRQSGAYWDKKQKTSLTNVHHVGGLEDQGRAAVAHKSYVPGERSKVVVHAENHFGVRGGNYKENLADILEVKTNLGRQEKVNQLYKQLDETVHPQTIDDLLGTSDLKIREYTKKQLADRKEFKRQFPDQPYPPELTHGNIKKGDEFPVVKIRDSNNKIIDTWQPKNIDEYERRFEIVTEKYYGGAKKINRKAIKIDPTLDIYSSDHTHTHNLIRQFRNTKGNPLHVLETAIQNGTYKNMPVGQAAKLYADAHKFQESIAASVLKRRYGKMEELWLKTYNKNGKGFRGAYSLNDWDEAAKQKFFKENASEIGRAGGLKEGVTPADVFLDASEGWTEGMTHVFGWKPTPNIKPTKQTNVQIIKQL